MRSILADLLWIGNARDASDVSQVLSLGIRHVIDLAASETPLKYPRDIVYLRLPLDDGGENEATKLRLAVISTAESVRAKIPTLVACSAGMSRSPAVVAAALALVEGGSLDEALVRITADVPCDVAPGLWADIKRLSFPNVPAKSVTAAAPDVDESGSLLHTQGRIQIELSRHEALVLFEYLRRCDDENSYEFADQAEQRVLWDLECTLGPYLKEVFDPNYDEIIRFAWSQVRDPD